MECHEGRSQGEMSHEFSPGAHADSQREKHPFFFPPPFLSLGCHPAVFLTKMDDFEAGMRGLFDGSSRLVYFSFVGTSSLRAAARTSEVRAKLDCLL